MEYVPALANLDAIKRAVADAGPYTTTEATTPTEEGLDKEQTASDKEYKTLMRKWWFGAAVGAPTMILSSPHLFPILRDWLPRGSDALRLVWMLVGVASLAVLISVAGNSTPAYRRRERGGRIDGYGRKYAGREKGWKSSARR